MKKSKNITRLNNPFYFNVLWLSVLLLFTIILLSVSCFKNHISETIQHVIIGILYSAIVLLINEFVQLFRDRIEFGKLAGTYMRKEWFEKIEKGKRTEDLSIAEKEEKLLSGKQAFYGTSYYKFLYGFGEDWQIELKYLYKGLYLGKARYPQFWADKNLGTSADISIHLDNDLSTGSGTYSYEETKDFGRYSFQVNETNENEIIIQYKNIIPSGIAEGYEIWTKLQSEQ